MFSVLCLNKLSVSMVPLKFGRSKVFGGKFPQCFGSGFIEFGSGSSILGRIPIRIRMLFLSRVFFINKWKHLQLKTNFDMLLIKNCYNWSLCLLKRRPSYRRSLQSSKENIEHFITWNFLNFFLFFMGHFCPPGSRSTDIRIRNTGIPDF